MDESNQKCPAHTHSSTTPCTTLLTLGVGMGRGRPILVCRENLRVQNSHSAGTVRSSISAPLASRLLGGRHVGPILSQAVCDCSAA